MKPCIKVNNVSSEFIQQLLFKYGYKWGGSGNVIQDLEQYQYVHLWDNTLGWGNEIDDTWTLVTFEELCEFLDKPRVPTIAGHEVSIDDKYLKVGCEKVAFKEIEELNKWLVDKDLIKCTCLS